MIATGEAHSVRDFLNVAGERLKLDWEKHVEIDPRYFRPTEVDYLLGTPRKAVDRFGWKPDVSFTQLVEMMVDNDLALAEREMMLRQAGHQVATR